MQKAPNTSDYDAFAPNEVGLQQPKIQFPLDSFHILHLKIIKINYHLLGWVGDSMLYGML